MANNPHNPKQSITNNTPARPLPKGTVIEWCDMEAVVAEDNGGPTIEVFVYGSPTRTVEWYWESEGYECVVVEKDLD